jgi:four helix bundle protein
MKNDRDEAGIDGVPEGPSGRPAPPSSRDIQERTFRFAAQVLRLVRDLPRDDAARAVSRQLARSGTSVGANVEEAQGALSKREFVHRMNIARAEARETLYWLRLARELGMLPEQHLGPALGEADELVRILTAIVKTSRARDA